ncbi:MAP3K7 C-terminal-like protein isoform X4 [Chiloscyllium punctatum]|uniref:MAP3K7 C-terminal-like protein isoform X4 n=1 Tax=Chiloscyllium punctatum TaxID=137246 RepID=UPI003B63564D
MLEVTSERGIASYIVQRPGRTQVSSERCIGRCEIVQELNIPDDFIPNVYLQLDQHLQPLQPCLNSKESILVFQQHCRIAEEYHKVQKEIALLQERKKQLIAELDQDEKDQLNATHLTQEYQQLAEENHSLTTYHLQCREHLEKLQVLLQQQQGSS